MISFTLMTSDPAELKTRLVARGILQNVAGVVPTFDGLEYVQVPNPIVAVLGAVGPPRVPLTMDPRNVYLVKLVRAAETDEMNGDAVNDAQGVPRLLWLRTKLGKWVFANSVAETIAGADGATFRTRRVGTKFWFIRDDDAPAFGVWQ